MNQTADSRLTALDGTASTHPEAWMRMLRRQAVDRDRLSALAPAPLRVKRLSNHSTGTQVELTLWEEGSTELVVWLGSWWVSDIYTQNDRDDVLGIQPGCEFAMPLVEQFFTALAREIEEQAAAKARADRERKMEATGRLKSGIDYWKDRLHN